MSHTTIGILGGYGNTGREVARLLLEHTNVHLVLAGRDAQKASQAAEMWNARVAGQRVRALRADAAEADSLRRVFEGIDLVVVASSSSAYVQTVAEAALEAGIDYMDPQYSSAKLGVLRSMAARIEAAGLCFITDAGFHPGLPAALVRFAGQRLGRITSATVSSIIQEDWARLEFSPSTIEELVVEFRDYQALHFKDGRWRSMGWLEMMRPIWMTFSHGFGRRYTVPMFLEEMRPLPDLIPGLQETGFYVGGFNPVADYLILPLVMGLVSVAPRRGLRLAGRMLAWGLQRFSKPPFGTLLRLEARGGIDGQGRALTVEVYHYDGYVLTAAPMVACLLQVLDGSRRQPGLHLQALLVEPARLLADLQRMGIDVVIQEGGEAPDGG